MKVIDNKKIDLTEDEWNMYIKIVKSYTTITNKGEDLFADLFETDDNGVIIFLKPPSKRQTSFEVFLFLMSIMAHQHLRLMHKEVGDICSQMKEKMKELDEKLNK
jgi:hypothetical protein